MALEIIGFPRSNFVRTVRMVAVEKQVEYELVPEAPHSELVKSINPFGLIPCLRHDGLEIAESQAIARYIDAIGDGPSLIPNDNVAAARVNHWVSLIATRVDTVLLRQYIVPYLFHKDESGNTIRTEIDKALKRFPRVFGTLDAAVASGHVAGPAFSMADCFLLPMLAGVQLFPEGKEAIANHAALAEYLDRQTRRESFIATNPY